MNKRSILTRFYVYREGNRHSTDPVEMDPGEIEIELDVKGTVHFGSPGKTWGSPENCYPAEPDEVFIDYVKLSGKDWISNLTDSEMEELEQMFINEAYDEEEMLPSSNDPADGNEPENDWED